jgi:uncharacterized protein
MTVRGRLLVSVHDVSQGTMHAAQAWVEALDARGVPCTLLVVAGPYEGPALRPDSEVAAWLRAREAGGDEAAVHGWSHEMPPDAAGWRRSLARPIARGAAELAAVSEPEGRRVLTRCAVAMASAGLRPVGLTPPGYLLSPAGRDAARAVGLRYTASHLGVHDALEGRTHRIPAFCHRPGTRLEGAGAALLVTAVGRLARLGRSVRIGLHPADLTRPALRSAALNAIEDALAAGLHPTTYREAIEHPVGVG